MLLGVGIVLAVVIGVAVWLLTRREHARPAPAHTGEWVFIDPAGIAPTPSAKAPEQAQAAPAQEYEPQATAPLEEVEPLSSEAVFARLHQLSLGAAAVGE